MGSPASQPHTLLLPPPGLAQAKRAAPQARRRQRSAPGWVETPVGSMRSTRARSGTAGDARNRRTSKPLPLKPDEERNLFCAFTTIRQSTKPRIRLYDETAKFSNFISTPPRSVPLPPTPSSIRGLRRTRHSAPPKRGAGAMISRPCCASRSGCARPPRPRPGGRRWWPGTTDHPASPIHTDGLHG